MSNRHNYRSFIAGIVLTFGFLSSFAQTPAITEHNYKLISDIQYYSDSISTDDPYIRERCVLDLYFPEVVDGYPTIIWFHGGGLKGGQKHIPGSLKEKGVAVVAVNYRLNPKVHSPEYVADAAAAVAWTFRHIAEYGGDTSLIFISGHSAGGYLASMVGLDKQWLMKYGVDANAIAGLIPFSGHAITHMTVREERGIPDIQPVVDDMAPLYHVRPDAPPLLLITGDRELEILGRYEENAYLMRMMRIAGHTDTRLFELQGYGHLMREPAFPLLLEEVDRVTRIIRGN